MQVGSERKLAIYRDEIHHLISLNQRHSWLIVANRFHQLEYIIPASSVQNLWQVSRYLLDVFSLLSIAKRFLPYRSLGLLHTRHTQTHSVYPRCHSRTEIKFMEIKSLKFFQLMLLTAGWLRWYLFSQPLWPYHFQLLFCALCQSFPMHFVCDLKWRSSLSFVHSLHFYYYYSVGCDFCECALCALCSVRRLRRVHWCSTIFVQKKIKWEP